MILETEIDIPKHPLRVPVLFLVFNRLDTTKEVFAAIKKAEPLKLYIASDGARFDRDGEEQKVLEVRDYILDNIDWDCDVQTLFREKNLGCKYAVSGAIDWFFEHEEMGIILEDDCLPSQSFFWYCQELLVKYKDDMRVWHISGDNLQKETFYGDGSYFFSMHIYIWGWATWKRAWKYYDIELKKYPIFVEHKMIQNIFLGRKIQSYWLKLFDKIYNNEIDTWDYQWVFACFSNNALAIVPCKNLVSNIGFNIGSTHTSGKSLLANLRRHDFEKIVHPSFILRNADEEKYTNKHFINPSIYRQIINRIKYQS